MVRTSDFPCTCILVLVKNRLYVLFVPNRAQGYMDAWPFGFMAKWIHGSLDPWQNGFMAVWIHGKMDSWQFGFMALWMNTVWIHGTMNAWHFGFIALWMSSTLDAWYFRKHHPRQ